MYNELQVPPARWGGEGYLHHSSKLFSWKRGRTCALHSSILCHLTRQVCQLWWQKRSLSAVPNEKPWSLGNTCWSTWSWKRASLRRVGQQRVASSPVTNTNTPQERNIHPGTPSSTSTALLVHDDQPKPHARRQLVQEEGFSPPDSWDPWKCQLDHLKLMSRQLIMEGFFIGAGFSFHAWTSRTINTESICRHPREQHFGSTLPLWLTAVNVYGEKKSSTEASPPPPSPAEKMLCRLAEIPSSMFREVWPTMGAVWSSAVFAGLQKWYHNPRGRAEWSSTQAVRCELSHSPGPVNPTSTVGPL